MEAHIPFQSKGPVMLIVGGPNGAGKSTSYQDLRDDFAVVLDADEIAASVDYDQKEARDVAAGKQVVRRLTQAIEDRKDILIESTLSGTWLVRHILRARTHGYTIGLWYVWVRSVELTIKRIEGRVQAGGHSIPEDVVRRRYNHGINNFLAEYRPLADFGTCSTTRKQGDENLLHSACSVVSRSSKKLLGNDYSKRP